MHYVKAVDITGSLYTSYILQYCISLCTYHYLSPVTDLNNTLHEVLLGERVTATHRLLQNSWQHHLQVQQRIIYMANYIQSTLIIMD